MNKFTLSFLLFSSFLLSACGGGGGGSSSDDTSANADGGSTPMLSIIGGDRVLVELNTVYTDAGAEAVDAEDGDISASIVADGLVDTSNAGAYTITYNVADSTGVAAPAVIRTVLVVAPLTLTVDSNLKQDVTEIDDPDGGSPRPVAAISSYGKTAHMVENEILIATDDSRVLEDFLARWQGVLLETAEMDGTPDLHTVFIDPSDVSTDQLESHIKNISELHFGDVQFSSEKALKLYSIVAAEMSERDLIVSLNWLTLNQSIPSGSTTEQVTSSNIDSRYTYTPDAFQWPYMNQGSSQDTGAASAWQTLELLGVTNTARVMVIDSGFVDIGDYPGAFVPAGAGWGARSTAGCSSASCAWHGTEVAHVALATPDNNIGVAGAAGPHAVLEPVQFSGIDIRGVGRIFGLLLSAPLNGPPAVVNISGSVDIPPPFNAGINRLLDPLFDRGLDLGILVVAAAGNDGEDVDDSFTLFFIDIESSTVIPCETSSVICVGGLQWDSTSSHRNSNYGSQAESDSVDIFASYQFWVPEIDNDGVDLSSVKLGSGTSFSAPFVSGVIAMMKAANPDLSAEGRARCLLDSAHQGDGVRVHSRGGNQRRVDAFASVVCALGRRAQFPLMSIRSPADGQSVTGRSDLVLNAVSMGQEGVPLNISWSSDRDGRIAGAFSSGVDTVWRDLSIGTHVLTAEVTDSDGATLSETVSVTVTNNPPTASILSPRAGESFGLGQSIALSALAEDIDAAPSGELQGSQVAWSIVGQSFTATGSTATIPAGLLGVGEYTLRLIADDGSDTAEDSVVFSVGECTGACPTAAILAPGNIVIKTSSTDDQGRLYADIQFEGFATDAEDGDFAGRVGDGPMRWTAVNESGTQTNICIPFSIGPPLSQVVTEQVCDTFTARLYLGATELNQNYVITLEVTDSDGNRATDTISISLSFDLI